MTTKSIVLPKGRIGITFDGYPPRVASVAKDSPLFDEVSEGCYAQTLIVPGCEVSFIPNATQLDNDLRLFEHQDRTLVLRDFPIAGPPIWTVSLPTGPLGIHMQGFPPVITGVSGVFDGKDFIRVGLTVDRLFVPGLYDLSLATGGFTDARVVKVLNETSHVEGRFMVLSDVLPRNQTKSAPGLLDLGGFKTSQGWSFKRMFKKGGNGFF
jgi:hypothetical protein